jgi:DNA modification methylase
MNKPVIVGTAELYFGDCLEVMRALPDSSVDSVVTDPPYELGFMGKAWDASGIANSIELWKEVLRVLKPGGHLLAFSGSRTYHRMTCAIEDAGFEVRDNIARFYTGDDDTDAFLAGLSEGQQEAFLKVFGRPSMLEWIYGSGFPKSHNLEGKYDGWGTALKPAHEPICVARKPFNQTVADNVNEFGTGAINIDACRIGETGARNNGRKAGTNGIYGEIGATSPIDYGKGRWPANVIHDGSEEVISNFPITTSGQPSGTKAGNNNNVFGQYNGGIPVTGFGDSGSASRFFYCAKTTKDDRDEGMNMFELKEGGIKNDSGRGFSETNPNKVILQRNNHPTVKPTELMQYLCRLVTPIGGIVLDPFMGSGSTGKAAWLEGFKFIGIEKEADYFEIAKARVKSVPAQDRMFA